MTSNIYICVMVITFEHRLLILMLLSTTDFENWNIIGTCFTDDSQLVSQLWEFMNIANKKLILWFAVYCTCTDIIDIMRGGLVHPIKQAVYSAISVNIGDVCVQLLQ